jgi:uncharacterized membrane protein YbaN (DUF454 family)
MESTVHRRLKHVLVALLGWTFLVLGIAGLFLPVLQGILFILIGLIILSTHYTWARRLLTYLRRRFPRISSTADEASARASAWLRRVTGQNTAD